MAQIVRTLLIESPHLDRLSETIAEGIAKIATTASIVQSVATTLVTRDDDSLVVHVLIVYQENELESPDFGKTR